MSQHRQSERTVQECVNELMRAVQRKEEMAAAILQLAAQERQAISLLPACAHKISHSIYRSYLHQECYLLLRVRDDGPIWLSDNLQLAEWSVLQGFENALENNVHQLHDNLTKYESVIASLKELKEMQQLEKEQEEYSRDTPNRELKLKRYITTLEKEIFDSKAQISQLQIDQTQLLAKIAALQEREKGRKELKALENRFKECNEVALSEPPKRRHKKILINY